MKNNAIHWYTGKNRPKNTKYSIKPINPKIFKTIADINKVNKTCNNQRTIENITNIPHLSTTRNGHYKLIMNNSQGAISCQ